MPITFRRIAESFTTVNIVEVIVWRRMLDHCQADVVAEGKTVGEVLYSGEEHHQCTLGGLSFDSSECLYEAIRSKLFS